MEQLRGLLLELQEQAKGRKEAGAVAEAEGMENVLRTVAVFLNRVEQEKANLIKNIERVIKVYGSFHFGELENIDGAPIVFSCGDIIICADEVSLLGLTVEVFDTRHDSVIDTAIIPYKDLSLDTIKELDFAANIWEEQNKI